MIPIYSTTVTVLYNLLEFMWLLLGARYLYTSAQKNETSFER